MLKHILIWLKCYLTVNWRNSAKVEKCSKSCEYQQIFSWYGWNNDQMLVPIQCETCSNLICGAISLQIEETVQKSKSGQNHVNIYNLLFDFKKILIRCCSPFNAETCSNLIYSAISLWIEETVQKWKSVQNHVHIKKLPIDMHETMIRCCSPFNAETCSDCVAGLSHCALKKQCKSAKVFKIMWKSTNWLLIWKN